jgi:hypothetical protein
MSAARRLDKLEASLTNDQILQRWLDETMKFKSRAEYMKWVCQDMETRHPFRLFLRDLMPIARSKSRQKAAEPLKSLLRAQETLRVGYYLFERVNETVEQRLRSCSSLAYPLQREIEFLESDLQQLIVSMPLPLFGEEGATVRSTLENYLMPQRHFCDKLGDWIADCCFEATGQEVARAHERRMTKSKEVHRVLSNLGAIEWGYVELGPFPYRSLGVAPLIDGRWIDLELLKMAEFTSLLVSHGCRLQDSPHRHPLEPLPLANSSDLPLSEHDLLAVEIEAGKRLREFKGTKQNIRGRVYVDIDDYRSWTGRGVTGELKPMLGINVNHWNRWLDSQGGEGRAEIAGVKVHRLQAPFSSKDFVVCEDEIEFAHRSEACWRLREKVRETGVGRSQVREGVSAGLTAVLTLGDLVKRTERTLAGHHVIFRDSEEQLEQQIGFWKALATRFNLTCPASVEEGDGNESESAKSPIDFNAVRLRAESQSELLFNTIFEFAMFKAWQSLGRRPAAKKILSEFLAKKKPPSADGMQAAPKPKVPKPPSPNVFDQMVAFADESERAMKAEDEKKAERSEPQQGTS